MTESIHLQESELTLKEVALKPGGMKNYFEYAVGIGPLNT
jgi:hypothetical protein